MKFSTKLVAGFFAVSITTVLVGLIGYATTSRLAEHISNIVNLVIPLEHYSGEYLRVHESLRVSIRTLMNPYLPDVVRKNQYAKFDEYRKEMEKNFAKLKEISDGFTEIGDLIRTIEEKQARYFEEADLFIKLSRQIDESGISDPVSLERDIERFEKLHYINMTNILDFIILGEGFKVDDNAYSCEFTKWLESFQTENEEVGKIIETVKRHHKDFHESIRKIEEAIKDGDSKTAILIYKTNLKSSAEETFKAFQELLAIVKTSSELYKTITSIGMEELRERQLELQSVLKDFDKFKHKIAGEILEEATREAARAQLLTVLGISGGVVLAVILGLYYAQRVSRSIQQEMELREKAEESLREREKIFRGIFENPFTGVVIYEAVDNGQDFIIKEMNKMAEFLTKTDRRDVIGKKVTEAFPGVKEMGLFEVFQRVYLTGEEEYYPVAKYSDEKLKRRWYENHVFRLSSGEVIAIFEDRTLQKEAEILLQENQEKLSLFFSAVNDAIFVNVVEDNEWGRITEVNKTACRILEYECEELLQMKLKDIIDPSMKEYQKKAMESIIKEGSDLFETAYIAKSGKVIPVEVSAKLFKYQDQWYVISVARDLTERREADAEKENLRKQLLQAQKLESLGRLASGIAHDFNNMLVVILGYSEMILEKLYPGDPMRDMVEEIVKAAKRSASITQQLLIFSRKQVIKPEILNVNEVLSELEKMLRRVIGEDIYISLVLSDEIYPVMVDKGLFEQSIVNLVINARDAMPYGGNIIIETKTIELDETYTSTRLDISPGKYVLISVTDTGTGMDKETLSRIFEPFFTTKEKGKGTGLGLATVYGFVKQSGGSIQVYSEVGKGTTFKIYLPVAKALPVEEQKGEAVEVEVSASKHIMVIEDDEALREVFNKVLSDLGYKVTVAANGKEAISLVRDRNVRPDIIITDVLMPGMSGKEVVDQITKIHSCKKVIYMSGYTDNVIAHHGILDRGIIFLQKPFTIKELVSKIEGV